MDGRLGEGAEVPGRSGVVAAQRFAAVQPGQGSVEQRRAAHLTSCAGRRDAGEKNAGESRFGGPQTHLRFSPCHPSLPAEQSQTCLGPGRRPTPSPRLPQSTLASTNLYPCLPHEGPIKSSRIRGPCLTPKRCLEGVERAPGHICSLQIHFLNGIP